MTAAEGEGFINPDFTGPDDLGERFRRLIRQTGPISLAHYMAEANTHYYGRRDPLGKAGDFTTAPEISQLFGEMIGLWLAGIWRDAHSPADILYIELGPGRGTLARDVLRTLAQFGCRPRVHLVEGSAALRHVQQERVPGAIWHHDLGSVPEDAPILLAANEFLDALPIRQLVKTEQGWRERMVDLRDDRFVPVAGARPMDAAVPPQWHDAEPGAILETCPAAAAVMGEVARRLHVQGGAAIFIDYGHDQPRMGSTFQAVRGHKRTDPFCDPGQADLSAHVDFSALAEVAQAHGARWLGTMAQGIWLGAMGIGARAGALAQKFPDQAATLKVAFDRLTGQEEMGELFKVMGLSAPDWPDGAAF